MDPVPAALLFGRSPCQFFSPWPVESSGWFRRLLVVFGPLIVTNEDPLLVPFFGNSGRVLSVLLARCSFRAGLLRCFFRAGPAFWCMVLLLSVAAFECLSWLMSWFAWPCGVRFSSVCGAISSVPVVDIRLLLLLLYFPAFVNLDVP